MDRPNPNNHEATHADSLASDPRIIQAKALILEAVKEHQNHLTGVKPPLPSLKQKFAGQLSQFAQHRGGKLWFPFLGSGLGKGALVELLDGSVKYDFITGIGPLFFGHSHEAIIEACINAAFSDTVMQGHLQQNDDSAELSATLTEVSGLAHCFLSTSGAMANENALKIAFQKKHPAFRVLAFERCFVGRTTALASITDKPSFREGLPPTLQVDYIPFFDYARPEESTKQAVSTLKKLLFRYPKEYAVMCFELVQGEGGFYPGTKDFFVQLMTLLKDNHVAVFADEIQTFGRLPELFAFHYFGLREFVDLVSIGKLSQVCATLYTNEFCPRPGLLSQTFTGSTASIRASQTILRLLLNGGFYGTKGKIQKIFQYFEMKLTALGKKHPHLIEGPFGIGAMIVFTPLGGRQELVVKFVQELFEAGVMSFVAGSNPTRVRFLIPAGAVTNEDIDKALDIVEKVLIKLSTEVS